MSGAIGPVNWVDVAADGKTAILAGDDGNLYLWDLQRGALKNPPWKGSEAAISVVRFSPSGKSALSCGQDGIAHFWNTADASEKCKIENFSPTHPAKPTTAVFLSDVRAFVGFTNNARAQWDVKGDVKAGRLISGGQGGGQEETRALAGSPDGRLAAAAVGARPSFELYDLKKPGSYFCTLPPVAPECLAFAPDSRHLLVGCADGSLHYVAVTLPGEETASPVVKTPESTLPGGLPFDVGWDKPVDPDGDCKFLVGKNTLFIEVPGKDHDLGVDRGVMNAPRMLREVEGDFTAQVRVDGEFTPVGPSTAASHVPFEGEPGWC